MRTPQDPMSMVRLMALLVAGVLALAACGGDESTTTGDEVSTGEDSGDDAAGGDGGELVNACPAEGCTIFIENAVAASDGEIALTFNANFTPEFEFNHIHVFWDSQEAGSVSSDFEARGFSVAGKWHPTDIYPDYVTQADASVTAESRGESTTICVTAANSEHAVLDPGLLACRDVGDLLD